MKRILITAILLLAWASAWAGSTTVVVGQLGAPPAYSGDWTSDLTGGLTYAADDIITTSGTADKAFDDNNTTFWGTDNGTWPHWLSVDFGSGVTKTIERVTLRNYFWYGNTIKAFKVQRSDDNSSWTDVYTGQVADVNETQTFTFNNNTAARYWRIYATSPNWDTDVWVNNCGIRELEMMETSPTAGAY